MSPPAWIATRHHCVPFLLRSVREARAVADLAAELEKRIVGAIHLSCRPSLLNWPPKCLIGQRRVEEIPDVLMLVVQIADRRRKRPNRRESVRMAVSAVRFRLRRCCREQRKIRLA
jgi:hypothetical protein